MVKTEPGATNIFNLTRPEQYRCQVYYYHSRVSRLYLRIFKGASDVPSFHILFTDVAYMDCPVNWSGADFEIRDHDECIALLLAAGLVGQAILQFPGAYASLTDYTRLYSVNNNGKPIRIIASSATILDMLPEDLR